MNEMIDVSPNDSIRVDSKFSNSIIIESQTIQCRVIVKAADLMGESDWEVIFHQIIKVKITDEKFMSEVIQGKTPLRACCQLFCDMEIKLKRDQNYNIHDTEYVISKVHYITY